MSLLKRTKNINRREFLKDERHSGNHSQRAFAKINHRKLRKKSQVISLLDEIEGLGKIRKEALIEKFKSVKRMKKASVEELMQVSGITVKIASEIVKKLEEID